MTVLEVLDYKPLNGNTAVIVKGDGENLKNGIGILDSNGKPYVLISVGMSSPVSEYSEKSTPILVEGKFASDRIFV